MVIKVTWEEPENENVTLVEIYRCATKHGTYSLVSSENATDDGNPKSTSNSWDTTYYDSSGTFTDWYKVRFYDDEADGWSDYSEPITGNSIANICSLQDVKEVMETTGRFTDDDIFDAIKIIEDEMYLEMGRPIKAIWSVIGKIDSTLQDTYYVGENDVYRIDRVFYGTTTKTELFQDDAYKTNVKYGMIRILPVASGGPTLDTSHEVEIQYVPRIYHRVAVYRAAKFLLDKNDIIDKGKPSREVQVITRRLEMLEKTLAYREMPVLSSDYENYNHVYKKNRRYLIQDHDRNRYLSSYGWE